MRFFKHWMHNRSVNNDGLVHVPELGVGTREQLVYDIACAVLTDGKRLLENRTTVTTPGGCPRQCDHDGGGHSVTPTGYSETVKTREFDNRLRQRLGDELREQALNVERDVIAARRAGRYLLADFSGRYRFAFMLGMDKNHEVVGIRGAVVGDGYDSGVFNVEAPSIVEILAADVQRPLTDRVRIFTQLVGIYSDAVRFYGFRQCPLGDAVSVLSEAVAALRLEQAEQGGAAGDAGDDDG